ncbi:MAG: Spy/CpxP family protein refolding chaperone, partial [Acidobacteria bacterium]|nr:Spy/CpxP family protein refolding chaperone [Acidobacteriota bacterium]
MKKFLTGTGMILGLAASLGVAAFAQQPQQTGAPAIEQRQERMGRMGRMGKHHGEMDKERGHMKMFRELNLTDAQKQQLRAVHEKAQQSTQAQREELRQLLRQKRQGGQLTAEQETRARQLRAELRDAHQRIESEVIAILTPEQRKQLEQKRDEFKQHHREMR